MIKMMFLLLLFSSLGRASTQCGRSLHCERGLVVGGTDTCIREFPWHVSLVKISSVPGQKLQPFCGASIISRKFLVSAAHCFFRSKDDPEPNARRYRAYPDFDDRSDRFPAYLRVKRIELHEGWREHPSVWRRGDDIALLQLRDPVDISGVVSPICLPTVDQGYLIEEGRKVKMAGFGKIKEFTDRFSLRLQKGDFQVLKCNAKNDNICADEVKNGKVISSTCVGDSGGGLVGQDDESFYLVGIVSWGRRCGAVNFTTRYTNVFRHLDWINKRICLTENDNVCILPFTYGENHTQCIIDIDNINEKATCPISLDDYNEGKQFEFCSDTCPGYKDPVDGIYGPWTEWDQCSRSCGGGKSERTRTCDSPTPKYGGKLCADDDFEEKDCNNQDCPPFFTSEESEIIPAFSNCTGAGELCYNVQWLRTNGKCQDLVTIYDEVEQGDLSRVQTALEKTCNYEPYGFCCSTAGKGNNITAGAPSTPSSTSLSPTTPIEATTKALPSSTEELPTSVHIVKGPVYFIAGGNGARRDISVYHPTVDNVACSISPPTLNNDWYYHTTFYHDNTVHLCGGRYTASTCISHNKDTAGWNTHTLTTSRKHGHSSVVLHNRVYFIGGLDSSYNYISAESTPLPLTDTPVLTTEHNLDYKGYYQCTATIDEDTLVVTGGNDGSSYLTTVATYQVKTRTYTQLPSLKQARSDHGCGVLERGNTKWIIVAGGFNGGYLQSTEMLQLGGREWTKLGNLNVARDGHSMAVTMRGVMVMGGWDGSSRLSSVELLDWDSAGKTWSVVQPSLNKPRYGFGGAVEIPASMFGCTG